ISLQVEGFIRIDLVLAELFAIKPSDLVVPPVQAPPSPVPILELKPTISLRAARISPAGRTSSHDPLLFLSYCNLNTARFGSSPALVSTCNRTLIRSPIWATCDVNTTPF